MRNKACHILVSDWDHRNPQTDLTDIETGRYLDALQNICQGVRMLLQDSDHHVQLDEHNRVVKIITKRNPEFLRARKITIAVDKYGNRIPIPSNDDLGIVNNPEDVYNSEEVEITRFSENSCDSTDEDSDDVIYLEEEQVPPMDRWDVIFDATEYLQYMKSLYKVVQFIIDVRGDLPNDFFKMSNIDRLNILNDLFDGDFIISKNLMYEAFEFSRMSETERDNFIQTKSDELIYSADWFPHLRDKRHRTPEISNISRRTNDLDEQELNILLKQEKKDIRSEVADKEKAKAMLMPLGKIRAKTILRSQNIRSDKIKYMKNGKCLAYTPAKPDDENNRHWTAIKISRAKAIKNSSATILSQGEKDFIRGLWQLNQAKQGKEVKLPHWRFHRMYSGKLLREVRSSRLTFEEATDKLKAAMTRLYSLSEEVISKVQLIVPDM